MAKDEQTKPPPGQRPDKKPQGQGGTKVGGDAPGKHQPGSGQGIRPGTAPAQPGTPGHGQSYEK